MSTIRLRLCLAAFTALAAFGCATTSFVSTWKAPDAQPLQFQRGDKIIAMVISDQVSLRRSGEAHLASVLDARGFKGVPAYMLIPEDEVRDEGKAKIRVDSANVAGIVVFRPMGAEKELVVTSSSYGSPYYGGFWGGGYYGYGWGGAYGSQTTSYTNTYVSVETLIYDLRQNKLVWAGRSKTSNPSDMASFVNDLAEAVTGELRSVGLIAAK
jgi:hypothetical protein